MTRDDIIKLARKANIDLDLIDEDEGQIWYITFKGLERFATLVAAAEREACAKVCEDMAKGYEERAARSEEDRDINPEVARIAVMTCGFVKAAIRARGQA